MANLGVKVSDTSPAIVPDGEPLIGRYVALERMQESDFPSLWSSVGAHEEVFVHWPDGPFSECSQFTDSLKQLLVAEPGIVIYGIFKRDHEQQQQQRKKEALGCLFLLPTNLKNRVIEMGALYGPALQKSRDATEAVYLGASLAFDKLNNRRLAWKTGHENVPSQRAAERWGFTFEGCLRQERIQQGRNRDTMWYSIIDGEWPARKRALELWLDEGNFDEQGKQLKSLGDFRRDMAQDLVQP